VVVRTLARINTGNVLHDVADHSEVRGDFEFIDAHVHFYDLAHPTLSYSWLEPDFVHPVIGNIDAIKTYRYLLDNFTAESRFAGVIGAVHVQAALGSVEPAQESEFVNGQLTTDSMPVMLVGDARMQSDEVEETLVRHAAHPNFRGIRDFAVGDYLVDPAFHRGYALLEKFNMSYDLDATPENMSKARDLAVKFPGIDLILGHAGFPQERTDEYFGFWMEGMRSMAEAPNTACKISGLGMVDQRWTVESLRPWVLGCIEAFGVDRCMFATNWPVDRLFSSYGDVVAAYREIVAELTAEEQRKLFVDNARRWYRFA
jgi:predicted TIM-barrel fold metal-dependent hydrolase